MSRIDLSIQIPPLTEGWSGTPDDLLQFVVENGLFYLDGDAPAGQIGGARPTEDVGIYYSPNSVESFRDGKYQPITDVFIGALIASATATVPENYLICDGRSLVRTEYPELFTAIGTQWGTESDSTFSLPDLRGRVPVGSGTGSYAKQGISSGAMKEIAFAAYLGFEWLYRVTIGTGQPSASINKNGLSVQSGASYLNVTQPSAGVAWMIRYR